MDPGDLDPDSDLDPDPQHCSYVHILYLEKTFPGSGSATLVYFHAALLRYGIVLYGILFQTFTILNMSQEREVNIKPQPWPCRL